MISSRVPALVLTLVVAGTVASPAGSAAAAPPASAATKAAAAYARLTPAQRVGQLFMMGVPSTGVPATTRAALVAGRAGNAFFYEVTTSGRAVVAHRAANLRHTLTHARVQPFLGTDQEGGEVQDLRGPGFSRMPTALDQGRATPAALQRSARGWGGQLRAAGLDLDLAPVADTVPSSVGTRNAPIGALLREYGHTPGRVAAHVSAVVRGLRAAHVETAVKHFPGLGRATGNTDDTANVTDPTTAHDPYLAPYAAGIRAGSRFVMVSSARYPHIDATHQACFSPVVMQTLLRERLGFTGIIVSDSFGARAVRHAAPGDRAVRFLRAGGTMVLDTAPGDLRPMARAVLTTAAHDPRFAALVRGKVLRVLTVKAQDGLL